MYIAKVAQSFCSKSNTLDFLEIHYGFGRRIFPFSGLFDPKIYMTVTLNAIRTEHSHHFAMFESVLCRDWFLIRLEKSERT